MDTIKAGTLFTIESGEYSSYQVTGFFVALQDFDPMEQAAKAGFDKDQLLASLIRAGLVLEIQHGELWISDYAKYPGIVEHEPVRYTPPSSSKSTED